MRILKNEPMSAHTSFKVGGPAKLFMMPESEDELREAVAMCERENLPRVIIGRGSNLLVSDEGVDGAVIRLGEGMASMSVEGNTIRAEAGVSLASLAACACEHGLAGLEFAAGIPGSLGGALLMNAGAYGGEMKDVVKSVRLLMKDGTILEKPSEYMEYGYRHSRAMDEGCIIIGGTMELRNGDRAEIRALMDDLAERRRSKQPLEYPSAGSFFKRPEGHFAGALIEETGLKGLTVGGAQVSVKHAGFIINIGGATASDICELSEKVTEAVYNRYGVRLEPEVRRLGRF